MCSAARLRRRQHAGDRGGRRTQLGEARGAVAVMTMVHSELAIGAVVHATASVVRSAGPGAVRWWRSVWRVVNTEKQRQTRLLRVEAASSEFTTLPLF